MKEYRLKSWPELPSIFRHTAHRRVLTELSQRHARAMDLRHCGLTRRELGRLLSHLERAELVDVRRSAAPMPSPWIRLQDWWRGLYLVWRRRLSRA